MALRPEDVGRDNLPEVEAAIDAQLAVGNPDVATPRRWGYPRTKLTETQFRTLKDHYAAAGWIVGDASNGAAWVLLLTRPTAVEAPLP